MITKKSKLYFFSTSQIFLFFGIIFIINLLISGVSIRFDVTEGNLFTLSQSTKNIMQNLDDPITLKVFFSDPKNLPQTLIPVHENAIDLIKEYKKEGRKNIIVEFLNPNNNEKIQQEAKDLNIPEIQFSTYGYKELEIQSGYSGIAIIFHGDFRTIPFVSNAKNLEFEITSAMSRLTRQKDYVVGVLGDHGAGLSEYIKNELRKEYIVRDIKSEDFMETQKHLDAFIISGASEKFTEVELYSFDQFIMEGKSLFVLHDPTKINYDYFASSLNDVSINKLLDSYGVHLASDIILDPKLHQILVFKTETLDLPLEYIAYPKIIFEGMAENPITKNITSLTLPFVSPIEISTQKNVAPNVEILAETSEESFTVSGNGTFLGPKQLNEYKTEIQKKFPVSVLVTKNLESAFAGQELPSSQNKEKTKDFVESTDDAKVFVISSSRFLEESNIKEWNENYLFFANAIDFLVSGKNLIDIRSKENLNRPIKSITKDQESFIRYVNVASSVILSIIIGLIIFFFRIHSSKKAKKIYV